MKRQSMRSFLLAVGLILSTAPMLAAGDETPRAILKRALEVAGLNGNELPGAVYCHCRLDMFFFRSSSHDLRMWCDLKGERVLLALRGIDALGVVDLKDDDAAVILFEGGKFVNVDGGEDPSAALASQFFEWNVVRAWGLQDVGFSLLPLLKPKDYVLRSLKHAKADGVRIQRLKQPPLDLLFDKEKGCLIRVETKVPSAEGETSGFWIFEDHGPWDGTKIDVIWLKEKKIGTENADLLEFLKRHAPKREVDSKIREWVDLLGAEKFAKRQRATVALRKIGRAALPILKREARKDTLERTRRVESLIAEIDDAALTKSLGAAARVLAWRKEGRAVPLLLEYLGIDEGSLLERELKEALVALARRGGREDQTLLDALRAEGPAKVIALQVLGRDDGAYLSRPGRLLLRPELHLAHTTGNFFEFGTSLTVSELRLYNSFDPLIFKEAKKTVKEWR